MSPNTPKNSLLVSFPIIHPDFSSLYILVLAKESVLTVFSVSRKRYKADLKIEKQESFLVPRPERYGLITKLCLSRNDSHQEFCPTRRYFFATFHNTKHLVLWEVWATFSDQGPQTHLNFLGHAPKFPKKITTMRALACVTTKLSACFLVADATGAIYKTTATLSGETLQFNSEVVFMHMSSILSVACHPILPEQIQGCFRWLASSFLDGFPLIYLVATGDKDGLLRFSLLSRTYHILRFSFIHKGQYVEAIEFFEPHGWGENVSESLLCVTRDNLGKIFVQNAFLGTLLYDLSLHREPSLRVDITHPNIQAGLLDLISVGNLENRIFLVFPEKDNIRVYMETSQNEPRFAPLRTESSGRNESMNTRMKCNACHAAGIEPVESYMFLLRNKKIIRLALRNGGCHVRVVYLLNKDEGGDAS